MKYQLFYESDLIVFSFLPATETNPFTFISSEKPELLNFGSNRFTCKATAGSLEMKLDVFKALSAAINTN